MAIHERLKQLRSHLGLTQRELATAIGVKPSYYSDLENGHRTITGKFLEKMKDKFQISTDWMYTGEGEMIIQNSEQNLYPKNVPSIVPEIEKYELEASKWEYAHRATRELEKESPELYSIVNSISEIVDFEDIIRDFKKEYLHDYYGSFMRMHKKNKEKPTYKEYKENWIKTVEELEPISDLLKSLAIHIGEFKAFFSEHDTKDILGYQAIREFLKAKKDKQS